MIERLRELGGAIRRDPGRRAAQTAAAAVGTYLVMSAAGLPEVNWAVISALFVTQASLGGTFASVVDRLLSTIFGTLVGLACIYAIGLGGWRTAVGLGVAAFAIDLAAAGLRPGLRYAHVVAGILILSHAADDALASALWRGLAIGVGALAAGLAVTLILPTPAHRRAEENLAAALRRCGDLLARLASALRGGDETDARSAHRDVRGFLEAAETMAERSRRDRYGGPNGPTYAVLTNAAQRIWHTLVMLDRVHRRGLSPDPRSLLDEPLAEIAAAAREHLCRMADAVAGGGDTPSPDEIRVRIEALDDSLSDVLAACGSGEATTAETERALTLAFVLRELVQDFDELSRLLGRDRRR